MIKGLAMRECGGCTLCCKLVAVHELEKPQNEWCKHCAIGTGCKIQGQPERPQSCADYDCLWRQGFGPEEVRPDRSKVVMGFTKDGKTPVLHVDPSRPDAFRAPWFEMFINKWNADRRGSVIIVCGDKRTLIKGNVTERV